MTDITRSRASGRWLCLVFSNTVENYRLEQQLDNLVDFPRWVEWSTKHGLVEGPLRERLLSWAAANPAASGLALESAKALRLRLFRLLSARAAGAIPDTDALAFLNEHLAMATAHLELQPTPQGVVLVWQDEVSPERLVWPIVYSAACLLTHPQSARLRRCGGDKCTWLFIDESKNGSRLWCDMSVCGNRAKSRRHYERTHRAPSR